MADMDTASIGALLHRLWVGDEVSLAPVSEVIGQDLYNGLACQLALADAHVAGGDSVAGWKVGLTSGRSHDIMGSGFRPFGHLIESRLFRSGETVTLTGNRSMGLEPELALVLAHDLEGVVSAGEARNHVASVHAAFEINEFRLENNATHALQIADNLSNWGIVLGEGVSPPENPEATSVSVVRKGVRSGKLEPVIMDSPYVSLSRLSQQLATFDRHLEAGQVVLTGSFAHLELEPWDDWIAEFGELGASVRATFVRSDSRESDHDLD